MIQSITNNIKFDTVDGDIQLSPAIIDATMNSMYNNIKLSTETNTIRLKTTFLGGSGGEAGYNGWSPILTVVPRNDDCVFQIIDWAGGSGQKPSTGSYLSLSGDLTDDINQAANVRGLQGLQGIKGEPGQDGIDGKPGEQGPPGPKGDSVPIPANSTEEWWTGYYWHDGSGRKAYRKWIYYDGPFPNNNYLLIPTNVSNLSEGYIVRGHCTDSLNQYSQTLPLIGASSSGSIQVGLALSDSTDYGNIFIRTRTSSPNLTKARILIEYCCSDH